jgi:hypothetical protein
MKEDEIGRAFSMHQSEEQYVQSLVGNADGDRLLGRPKRRSKDINMNRRELVWEYGLHLSRSG